MVSCNDSPARICTRLWLTFETRIYAVWTLEPRLFVSFDSMIITKDAKRYYFWYWHWKF